MASNSSSCVTCLNKSSNAFIYDSLAVGMATAGSITVKVDVDSERTDFLHQHVEGFRHAGIYLVFTLDDVFIHFGATAHIVGLDGEHFLQGISGSICLQRPDFHFAEALAAELGLAAQRLLGNERVRSGGTGVHFVVDQMLQFQNMHITDGDRAIERFS